jgi:hypothetical protein
LDLKYLGYQNVDDLETEVPMKLGAKRHQEALDMLENIKICGSCQHAASGFCCEHDEIGQQYRPTATSSDGFFGDGAIPDWNCYLQVTKRGHLGRDRAVCQQKL